MIHTDPKQMNNIVFNILFYTREARAQIDNGVPIGRFDKDTYYERCCVNVDRVESATPSTYFPGHTTLTMESGDEWVIKLTPKEYIYLVDHVVADKFLCRIQN